MLISHEFDEENTERRKRINRNALIKAGKLNNRILLFLKDVQENNSISNGQKNSIREELLRNLTPPTEDKKE